MSERDAESWQRIIGGTYAQWVVAEQRAQSRLAALMFGIILVFLVTVMLLAGFVPATAPYAIGVLATGGLGLAVLWFVLGRGREQLPLKIADDLWARGLPVYGLPRTQSRKPVVEWARRNGVTAAQLEATARAEMVRQPPKRSLGRPPLVMWVAMFAGVAGVLILTCVIELHFARVIVETATPGISTFRSPVRYPILGAAVFAVVGAYEVANVVAASRGSSIFRWLATWQLPVFGVGVVALLFLVPEQSVWAIIGGMLWLVFVLLVWTPRASTFVAGTSELDRAIYEAAQQRMREAAGNQ